MNRIFYLFSFSFFSSVCFYTPIFASYLETIQNLSNSQIIFLFSVYTFTTFLFEIPTGIFCDKIGEKKSLIIVSILTTISTSLFLQNNYYLFIVSQILYGVAQTFLTGCFENYTYKYCREKCLNFEKIISKIYSFQWTAICFSFGICFIINKFHLIIPFYLTLFFNIFCIPISMYLPALYSSRSRKIDKLLTESFYILKHNSNLLFICLLQSIFSMLLITGYQLFQILLTDKIEQTLNYGLIYFVSTFFAILGSNLFYKISKYNSKKNLLIFFCISLFIIYILLGTTNNFYLLFLFVCIYRFLWGLLLPFFTVLINKNLNDDEVRNSIFSFNSLVSNLISSIILCIFSILKINISFQFLILGTITFGTLFLLFFLKEQKNNANT